MTPLTKKQKLYCYVDETGQDTEGRFFLVALVVTGEERDELLLFLEDIERSSGKGKVKWNKARPERRMDYLEAVFAHPWMAGKLYFAHYHNTKEYNTLTIRAAARAILTHAHGLYKATIVVDGLNRSEIPAFVRGLRHHRVQVEKVVGPRDESNELIRLADMVAGFVRDALEGKPEAAALLQKAIARGLVRELA